MRMLWKRSRCTIEASKSKTIHHIQTNILLARDELAEDRRPTLVWSNTLERAALEYARVLANRNEGLDHSSTESRTTHEETQGENLARCSNEEFPLLKASKMWYGEKNKYRGKKIGQRHGYGHYTQVYPVNWFFGFVLRKDMN